MATRTAPLLAGVLVLACGRGDKGDVALLDAALAASLAAVDARCEKAAECYSVLYEDGHGCWIPTGGPRGEGRRGWIPPSAEEREQTRACMTLVYERRPQALIEYVRCTEKAIKATAICLDEQACPENAAECGRRGDDAQRACDEEADQDMLEMLKESC